MRKCRNKESDGVLKGLSVAMLIFIIFFDPGDIWKRELASLLSPVWVCGDWAWGWDLDLNENYRIKASDSALKGTSPAKLVSIKFLDARGDLGGGS